MREIKFRVYNPRDKKMHYDIAGFEFSMNGNMSGVFIDRAFFLIEEIYLMQYTGLKDKNGKEIYKGDIVEVSEYNRKRKYIVKFGKYEIECCGCCYEEHLAYGFYLDNKGSINDSDIDELEVIGNIHDNPELLEVQDE